MGVTTHSSYNNRNQWGGSNISNINPSKLLILTASVFTSNYTIKYVSIISNW
jgi:hypothetical protein